mgnify:CR=1 FL=1
MLTASEGLEQAMRDIVLAAREDEPPTASAHGRQVPEAGGNVLFRVVNTYIAGRQDAAAVELRRFYKHRARKVLPHVLADYTHTARLIGLTERQLRQKMDELLAGRAGAGSRGQGASPYELPTNYHAFLGTDATSPRLRSPASASSRAARSATSPRPARPKPAPAVQLRFRTSRVELPTIAALPGLTMCNLPALRASITDTMRRFRAQRQAARQAHWQTLTANLPGLAASPRMQAMVTAYK